MSGKIGFGSVNSLFVVKEGKDEIMIFEVWGIVVVGGWMWWGKIV